MEKDAFDYIEDDDQAQPPDRMGIVWNILTVLVLLTTVIVGIVLLTVLINPQVAFNPFPPPTMPVIAALDTPTPTPKSILPPTWTPTASPIPTNTSIPQPTNTPLPTLEEQAVVEDTEYDEVEIVGDMPIVLQDNNPYYIPAASMNNGYGCDWMGVAGQVFAMNNAPVQGLIIEVGGTLKGEKIGNPTILQATGLATAYGPGGYEVKLADELVDSSGSLWIRVLDQAGLPLSEKIYFFTYNDCEKNLILINFKQVR